MSSKRSSVSVLQCNITQRAAQNMAVAVIDEAERIGVNINVAVVDRSGTLMAFLRMSEASLHSMDTAIDKAYTAASFRFPTSQWTEVLAGFSEIVQLGILQRPRLVPFGGGLPIHVDGQVIGAIGVSGGNVEQDEQCATAGLRFVECL